MKIEGDKQPRLQVGDADAFAIDSCEVERDVEHSTLTNIVLDGALLTLPVGVRVTLYSGPNVVFVGKSVDEGRVLDLLSTETDEELTGDEII